DAVLAEEVRGGARLPDQALVDLRAGLDLLVGVNPDARQDRALSAEGDLVADRRALLNVRVGADVAGPAADRALRAGAAAGVAGRVDHGALGPGPFQQRHARAEHRVRADRRIRRDTAVVAEVGGPLDRVQVVDLHPSPQPDVPAQANAA